MTLVSRHVRQRLGWGRPPGIAESNGPRPRRSVPTAAPGADRCHRALIISGSVGAGHDGAANELAQRLRRAGVTTDVRDYLGALPGPCRIVLRDGYTTSVRRVPAFFEWLFTRIETNPVVRGLTLAFCRIGNRRVRRWVREHDYDVVVSTYPLASQTLGTLRGRRDITVPVVTYLTDPAVHRTWVHPAVDRHLTVTAEAASQGEAEYGVAMTVAGPLVPGRFALALTDRDRSQLRHQLGLPAGRKVALLVTGSLGLGDVEESVVEVLAAGLTPLALCGHNAALRRRLAAIPGVVAIGWRDDMHALMNVADVLVHNAGGLSFTEAMVAGLPAVSYRCIPGHGMANAASLKRAGLAPWAKTREEFQAALVTQADSPRRRPHVQDPTEQVLQLIDHRYLQLVPAPDASLASTADPIATAAPRRRSMA